MNQRSVNDESVARLPFHSLGLQRPREMLQVLRVPLTARTSCAAPFGTELQCSGTQPDVRLLLVALEHRYMHRSLTRLVPFLCWQTVQARVHPRVHSHL